ncbi:hypothetical protein SAMN04487761_11328 [Lachnospiraceae bacterium C7]|nr:hypothetical protein SAMN04487761_11328 [Lachnospiraceae bacterium C7]
MVNPASIMKMMSLRNKFVGNHPKVAEFFKKVLASGLPEGTVIEMTVTKPGQEPITANMKVLQSDIEMMEELKNLSGK